MSKKSVFRKAELNLEKNNDVEKKVSWLELYFDLFFVVVMYYLVHALAYDFSLYNLFLYTLMFLSSLWLWISYTYYKEVFHNHGLEIRIFSFFYMIPIASLAVFAHEAIHGDFSHYILSYFIARLLLTGARSFSTSHTPKFKEVGKKLTKGISLSLIVLILAFFDIYNSGKILFLLALIIDYINPIFTIKKQSELKLNFSKLPERFGLFLIIIIGEIVRGIVNSLSESQAINIEYIGIAILLFMLSYALWSIYFDYLPNKLVTKDLKKTFTWIYLHVILIYFLTIIGGVLLNFNLETLTNPNTDLSIYLTLSISIFMILMGVIGKIVDGKKTDSLQKKRYLAKIFTGVAILIYGIVSCGASMITLLSGIVLLLILQIVYSIRAWQKS